VEGGGVKRGCWEGGGAGLGWGGGGPGGCVGGRGGGGGGGEGIGLRGAFHLKRCSFTSSLTIYPFLHASTPRPPSTTRLPFGHLPPRWPAALALVLFVSDLAREPILGMRKGVFLVIVYRKGLTALQPMRNTNTHTDRAQLRCPCVSSPFYPPPLTLTLRVFLF
jgi:hypothetical protein